MKIWLVNHYALPPSRPGGTRHYSLAWELIAKGHHVTLFASSFAHGGRAEDNLQPNEQFKLETISGVPFCWIRTPIYAGNASLGRIKNMVIFSRRLLRITRLASFEKPDIVVGSSQHLFAALAAERLAKRHGVPFVFEVRDLMPQTLIDVGGLSPRHPAVLVFGKIERYLYRRASIIVSLLPRAVEHMVQKGAKREKVVCIPNGIDLQQAPPATPHDDASPVFTVMYAGAHGQANGMDTILDAAAILQRDNADKQIVFRLIGDGPEKTRLQQRARDEALTNVSFESSVPKSQVYALLAQADAFLLASKNIDLYKWGSSANKLYDYFSVGRPVIYGVNATPDPVADAQAGLTVPPEDAAAMAAAILQLAAMSPEERWQIGLNGRHYVEQNHDFRSLAACLEETLYAALEDGKRASAGMKS